MPTTTKLDPLHEARAHLRALLDDSGNIETEIHTAQADGDAAGWMQLLARQRELPALIRRAKIEVLPMELTAAWQIAEQRNESESALSTDLADRRAELLVDRDHANKIAFQASLVERAEHAVVAQVANDAAQAAEHAHKAAVDDTCASLFAVEQLENEMVDLTGEQPSDAGGFRARPQPATGNMAFTVRELGTLAEHLDDRSGITGKDLWDGQRSWFLPAGTVPPRWLAHRINHSHFDPRAGQLSEHELDQQRRWEDWQQSLADRPCGRPENGSQTRKVWVSA